MHNGHVVDLSVSSQEKISDLMNEGIQGLPPCCPRWPLNGSVSTHIRQLRRYSHLASFCVNTHANLEQLIENKHKKYTHTHTTLPLYLSSSLPLFLSPSLPLYLSPSLSLPQTHRHTDSYRHTDTHRHIHTHTYIHTHTHTHTQTQKGNQASKCFPTDLSSRKPTEGEDPGKTPQTMASQERGALQTSGKEFINALDGAG